MNHKLKKIFILFLLCTTNLFASANSLVDIKTKCGNGPIIECSSIHNKDGATGIKCINIPFLGSKVINNGDHVSSYLTSIEFDLKGDLFKITHKKGTHIFQIDQARNEIYLKQIQKSKNYQYETLTFNSHQPIATLYMKNQALYLTYDECKDL